VSVWTVVWRVVDAAFGLAMAADERNERRKMRKRLDELGSAMDRDELRRERTRAPTVLLPRPTIPPAASAAGLPSAPKTPPRRR
jgi:hypothetical protein